MYPKPEVGTPAVFLVCVAKALVEVTPGNISRLNALKNSHGVRR